jgi:hypothetical protein
MPTLDAQHTPPAPTPADGTAPEPSTDPAASHRSYAPLFMKGCGFSLLSIVLAVGVMVASKGDSAAMGSALIGVVFLLLILSSSGLTGFWGDKK